MNHRVFTAFVLLLVATLPALLAEDRSLDPVRGPALETRLAEAPLRLGEALAPLPERSLEDAFDGARDAIAAMEAHNASGRLPVQNGVARPLPLPLEVRQGERVERSRSLEADQALHEAGESVRWATRFDVEGSHRLRVRLERVSLPAGTRLWVHGAEDEAVGPLAVEELLFEGALWTPSVAGPTLFLELEIPGGEEIAWGFAVREVLELFELGDDGRVVRFRTDPDTSCLQDAACFGNNELQDYDFLSASVAHLQFVVGGDGFICSGNLLNNTAQDFVPYFLTANHCFSTQSAASSLEAFWDFRASSCGGSAPSLGSLPRSNGATLLRSRAASDFTFLRLSSVPSSRIYLGWTTATPADEGLLYRISHPLGLPQAFSTSSYESNPGASFTQGCGSNADFLYTDPIDGIGATFGGSSGSSVVTANLQVVGQLSGGCGSNIEEPCQGRFTDFDFDGRFSVTFPQIQQWLAPSGGGGNTQPCVENLAGGVICLDGGRFEFTITWTDPNAGGAVKPLNLQRFSATAALGYFTNPNNVEVLAKVINGCSLNQRYWIFVGGVTDQNVTVVVRDTASGQSRSYSNPRGSSYQTVADTQAFATCS